MALDLISHRIFKHWHIVDPKKLHPDIREPGLGERERKRISRAPEFANEIVGVDLNKFKASLRQRVVPLNKAFPLTPLPHQIRPIVVSSPVMKLIEANFLNTFKDMVRLNINPLQVGFVPKQSTFTNIYKALKRINVLVRASPPVHVYGFFIDLKNAYGSIDRNRALDMAVEKGFPSQHANFLKHLYNNTEITIGKHKFTPKKGVVQGSMLSPFLFDIFFDYPIMEIVRECNIDTEDVFAYADDVMILATGTHFLRNIISTSRRVFSKYGLEMNNSKSGIVEFTKQRSYSSLYHSINRVPIVKEYKYLGTVLDKNLSWTRQKIRVIQKYNYIRSRLGPLLKSSHLDMRINMWTCMIRPILEYCLPTAMMGLRKNDVFEWAALARSTFRSFCGMKKITPTRFVTPFMGFVPLLAGQRQKDFAENTLEARWDPTIPTNDYRREKEFLKLGHRIPSVLVTYMNVLTMLCPKHGVPCSIRHMRDDHNIDLDTPIDLALKIQRWRKNNDQTERTRDEDIKIANDYIDRKMLRFVNAL